ARKALEEPDVRHRRGQLDVAHALAADLGHGHLDAALLAHHALVLHALVLAAQALVVLHRTEDAGAEQAVALGLERAVVDGFRLLDLAEGPAADALRRRDPDLDLVERLGLGDLVGEFGQFVHFSIPLRVNLSGGRAGGARFVPGAARSRIYSAASGHASCSFSPSLSEDSSTLRPSERISLTSTLKLSGMPASNVSSPLTIAS